MPTWVSNLPVQQAIFRADCDAKRLAIFPELVDALESVIEAEDTEEPLSNTQVAYIRNVFTRAKSIGSIHYQAAPLAWFLKRQAV